MAATPPLHITSAANPRVRALASLATKKGRREHNLFLAEGLQTLTYALQAGWKPETLVHTRDENHPLLAPLRQAAASCFTLPPALLARLTRRDNAQSAVATFRIRHLPLSGLVPAADETVLALDRTRDPGNLGTIIRSADAAGVHAIILIGDTTDPFAPECVRATMGSFFHTNLYTATEDEFLGWCQTFGGNILGTHLGGRSDFRTLPRTTPNLILMGNEQYGLTDALAAACTHLARIPMSGRLESLNLASATTLMLYETRRDHLAL